MVTPARRGSAPGPLEGIPPLENGDRLSRAEFERRYHAMPNLKKAELLEGVVYVPSPVRARDHGRQDAAMNGWLIVYSASTPGTAVYSNTTLRLDDDNEPQPDGALVLEGGRSRLDAEGYLEGPIDLAVEIASSSVSYDLGPKKNVYRKSGVREYIVWRVQDQAIDWFVLEGGAYRDLAADPDAILRSPTFPGLWLDREAMTSGDLRAALDVVARGLASPEHAAFVESIRPTR